MRTLTILLLATGFAMMSVQQASAQGATCRRLAAQGPLWSSCCAKSYAKHRAETMSRKKRMAEIERCVQNGGKL